MKNTKGFSVMEIVLIAGGFVLLSSLIFVFLNVEHSSPSNTIITNPVACTGEAKICPDGSSVERTGPNCEFSECPEFTPPGTIVPGPVSCTQEAKLCPDGSAVGRTGPNCEFSECPSNKPPVTTLECTKDLDCPSLSYVCQETQGTGTVCPEGDSSCVPTHTIVQGECKLREGSKCSINADCVSGNLCSDNVCKSPIINQCSGPDDNSCSTGYECVQGCGSPVGYIDELPPPYYCQLKGYIRTCPICLAENTLIDTPDGAVAVQSIEVGTLVWTTNTSGDRIQGIIKEVSKVRVPSTHQIVELTLLDGRNVHVSPGHPTITGTTVGSLIVGDMYDGSFIVSTDRVYYSDGATYDILPSGTTGFYWANDILLGSTLKK